MFGTQRNYGVDSRQSTAETSRVRFAYPPAVAPGDLVAVVAPSSPFAMAEFWRGLAWIRDRYRVRASPSVLSRDAYLAGDDARRTEELAGAMVDGEVKAILAARGGYGVTRIVGALPWDAFAKSPKWMVGFSDITALHLEAARRGIASIHAPHVTGLGREASPWTRAKWLAALERPTAPSVWRGLSVVHAGSRAGERGDEEAQGPLVGGNLALVEAMAAAGRLVIPSGAVLVLEDVTERPYRIDRMLTSLSLGGHLARASAIVFGGFTQCEPGADGRTVEEVLAERTKNLGVPVLAGAPFGHGMANDAFVLGAHARVAGNEVSLG
jgi:muramoyltetrapeptide carboxypeptidase